MNVLVETLEHLAEKRDRENAASAAAVQRKDAETLLSRLAGGPVVNTQH